jgi:RimJ/RimL family protein N-acetyltransferase
MTEPGDGLSEPPTERAPSLPITLDLPHGGALTIRTATLADLAGLERLYDDLTPEDRHRRFFSGFRPDRRVIEGWVRSPEHGGVRVVAVDDDGRIVADAGYAVLPDGDAEFDITVDPAWRGWLGPYLLDLVVLLAASHGIPNLEAEVLTENRRMLAMLRSRGFAIIGHDDHSTLRVLIGTRTRMPSWPPGATGPRLLVEARHGRWRGEAEARARGFEVVVCCGPEGDATCPALQGEPCPLAADADAVVIALPDGDDPRTDRLVAAHQALHERPVYFADRAGPVRALAPAPGMPGLPGLPELPEDDTAVTTIMEALGLDTSLPRRDAPHGDQPRGERTPADGD